MKEISAKDVRWRLTEVLNEASFRSARFLITRNGKPAAVLIGVQDFENLMNHVDDTTIATHAEVRVDTELVRGIRKVGDPK